MGQSGSLMLGNRRFAYELDPDSPVAGRLPTFLPLHSSANNIGGEIWFRTWGLDLPYDGSQGVEFQVGDLVYWRSPDGEARFCLALFYGNTAYSGGVSPRASSPCVRIGRILGDVEDLAAVLTGDEVHMEQEPS